MKVLQVLSVIAVLALCFVIGLIGVVTQEATVNVFAADSFEIKREPPKPIDFARVHEEWLGSRLNGVALYEFAKKYKGKIVSFDCIVQDSCPSVDSTPSYDIIPLPGSDPHRPHALFVREAFTIRDRGAALFVKRAKISHVSPLCIIFSEGEPVSRLRGPASPDPDPRPDPAPITSTESIPEHSQ